MFPDLCEQHNDLVPELYFGGDEVPQYYRRAFPFPSTMEDLAREIHTVGCGTLCSGYVDDEGIHFHLKLEPERAMGVDMSRPFIFVSDPRVTAAVLPGVWQMLRFLQEPVMEALYLDSTRAVHVQKTPKTMELCEALDEIWQQVTLCKALPGAMKHARGRAQLLPLLMRTHERLNSDDPTMMWEFYPTFGPLLAEERLFLKVRDLR